MDRVTQSQRADVWSRPFNWSHSLVTTLLQQEGRGWGETQRGRMALSQTSFLFLLAILSISPQGVMCQDDERCLLESGGSTLRFLASEDLEIGDIIGKLGVKGATVSYCHIFGSFESNQ